MVLVTSVLLVMPGSYGDHDGEEVTPGSVQTRTSGSTITVIKETYTEVPAANGGAGGGASSGSGVVAAYSTGFAGRSAASVECGAPPSGVDPSLVGYCTVRESSPAPLPAPVAPAQAVVLTSQDVASLMVQGSGLTRQPPGDQVLMSLRFIVYTSSATRLLTTQVAGTGVEVEVTPTGYRWDWGDGTSTTTTDPGAPWPDDTVNHMYATTATDVVTTLTTTWSARYRSEGQATWQEVTGSVTTTETSSAYDVVRTMTYLTDDAEEAQGH